ncbi:MAG: relaxase domain-containing protein [Acidimicrobiales bacterium]
MSVQAYLHPDQAVRRETIAAHEVAVAAVVVHIEVEVMASRRGKEGRDGTVKVEIAPARYRHGPSRENDPQVHTHVVVVALCLGEDGRWRTLDSQTGLPDRGSGLDGEPERCDQGHPLSPQ